MKAKDVEKAKKSVVKVMGVHTQFNWSQPHIECEESQFGGTAFFIDPADLGRVPFDTRGLRFLFTNFHVVDSIVSKTVELSIPCKGFNRLTASIIHVVPALDVAILSVDPLGNHQAWRDGGSIPLFLDEVPNLKMDKTHIKGNGQEVIGMGYPSLSTDCQLVEGCISGRGLGMLQCNLSLNGGNSGGPLMHKNKVIGINTASEADTEAIGLAVPIHQILRFFRHWGDFEHGLMKIPSWGLNLSTLTEEYLHYHGIEEGVQGVLVDSVLKNHSIDNAGVKKDDIIVGLRNSTGSYNIDFDGLVSVGWTEKRVPISDCEFIISLDPATIELTIFRPSINKKIQLNVKPSVIHFKTDEKYHCWENIPYTMFGGTVWMNLSINHLEEDDDEEGTVPPGQSVPLAAKVKKTMNMESLVVCTHIPGQSYLETQRILKPYDILNKINGEKVEDVEHMKTLIVKLAKNLDQKPYALFELERCKLYIDLNAIALQEVVMMNKFPEPLFVKNMKRSRKRTRVYNVQ